MLNDLCSRLAPLVSQRYFALNCPDPVGYLFSEASVDGWLKASETSCGCLGIWQCSARLSLLRMSKHTIVIPLARGDIRLPSATVSPVSSGAFQQG